MSRRKPLQRGLTLIELLIVLAITGTIAAGAVPVYRQTLQKMAVTRAIADIGTIAFNVTMFERVNGRWPDDLQEMGPGPTVDPWGSQYVYRHSEAADWNGRRRRDRWLNPLNTDFDVYSSGPDGESRAPLPPPVSHDDIIRANGGSYIGEAWKF